MILCHRVEIGCSIFDPLLLIAHLFCHMECFRINSMGIYILNHSKPCGVLCSIFLDVYCWVTHCPWSEGATSNVIFRVFHGLILIPNENSKWPQGVNIKSIYMELKNYHMDHFLWYEIVTTYIYLWNTVHFFNKWYSNSQTWEKIQTSRHCLRKFFRIEEIFCPYYRVFRPLSSR